MKNSSGRAIRGPRKGKARNPVESPSRDFATESFFPFFIFFSLFPSRPNFVRRLEEDRNGGREIVDEFSWLERGNERFTSEIRTARRKSISAASMIVLLIPRATLSGRENCKLPVYDISYVCMFAGGFVHGEGRGEGWVGRTREKRIEIITPGTNRNFSAFCPDAIDALAVIL